MSKITLVNQKIKEEKLQIVIEQVTKSYCQLKEIFWKRIKNITKRR